MSLLLTLNIYFAPCSSVFIVNFEQLNTGWVSEKTLNIHVFIEQRNITKLCLLKVQNVNDCL